MKNSKNEGIYTACMYTTQNTIKRTSKKTSGLFLFLFKATNKKERKRKKSGARANVESGFYMYDLILEIEKRY